MSINKNKSEILDSFKNLLKKADEVKGLDDENKLNITRNIEQSNLIDIKTEKEIIADNNSERLGISSIKRIPGNPFSRKLKEANREQYEKFEYEITNKISNILNRHIYHWVSRELPKYSKRELRKHIYKLLSQMIK